MSIPDECYSNLLIMSIPDEGYSNFLTMSVPDEGYSNLLTMIVPDEGYSRNVLFTLNLISTFLLKQSLLYALPLFLRIGK